MADIKAKRLRFTKNGVSHTFEGGGSSDGIMAEGNVRGVRTYTTTQTLGSGWTNAKMAYLDGDESMFDATANEFVAPVDGLYLIAYRPLNAGITKQALVQIIHAEKSSSSDANIAFSHNPGNLNSSVQPMAMGITKLKAGQRVMCRVYYASMTIAENKDVPCEFYLISERTDGLVAEAKYETKANWPVDWVNCTYSSSTDTDVIALNGTITLPEDGNYLLSWDSLMPSNYASHVNHSGLSKTPTGTAILDWLWYETYTTAFVMLAGAQVISGKKGEKFYLKNYQATAQNSKTFTDEHKTHGVKLFKMSLAGGGGTGGGGSITLDDEMSDISENGVKNKVIKEYVDEYAGKIDTEYDQTTDTLIFKGARTGGAELIREHLTGETFNGKDVYEIYFTGTLSASNTGSDNVIGSMPSEIDMLLDIYGVCKQPSSGYWTNMSHFYSTSDYMNVNIKPDNTLAERHNNTAYNNAKFAVRVKYTKK